MAVVLVLVSVGAVLFAMGGVIQDVVGGEVVVVVVGGSW